MKTETKSFAEYKAPGCKVVQYYMNRAFMGDTTSTGIPNPDSEDDSNNW